MATYEISDPSGAVYHIDAPDNASQDDVLNYYNQNKGSATLPSVAGDLVKTIGSNLAKGAVDTAMILPNVINQAVAGPQLLGRGIASGIDKLAGIPEQPRGELWKPFYSSEDVVSGSPIDHTPETTAGRVAEIPTRLLSNLVSPVAINKGGNALLNSKFVNSETSGSQSELSDKFLQDLTTPRPVGNVRKDLAANATEEGLLNSRIDNPTSYQQQVMNTIKGTGVSPRASNLANRQTIEGALADEANTLRQNIAGSKVIYTPQDMSSRINAVSQAALKDDPLLVGDGERYLEIAANKMNGLVKANPGTPEGLLDARQQFDQWANSKGGFGDKDTAFRTAVSTVRSAANQYLADMVPTAAVKDSLTRQSHMYDAIDALNSKIAYDPPNSVARFMASPKGKALKYGAAAVGADIGYHKIGDMLASKKGDDE